MCTVTFIARRQGYALGMNRDEKVSRVQGLPPSKHVLNGRTAIFPSEPSGGTWIGVNEARVTFALINWYSVPARVSQNALSRGEVTRSVLTFDEPSEAEQHLTEFPLHRTNPFRLMGIFPNSMSVVEWRWDLVALESVQHDWQTNIWISSGFDEPTAERVRRETFTSARRNGLVHDVQWLRKLHASHAPTPGPFSICMHRSDAKTVSYTEVSVTDSTVSMAYSPSPLCCSHPRVYSKVGLVRQDAHAP